MYFWVWGLMEDIYIYDFKELIKASPKCEKTFDIEALYTHQGWRLNFSVTMRFSSGAQNTIQYRLLAKRKHERFFMTLGALEKLLRECGYESFRVNLRREAHLF